MISPDSILQSLAEGEKNVFTPIAAEPEKLEPSRQEWIAWHQSDFIQVAEAVHKQVWNESLDNWKIRFELFGALCNHVDEGLWKGSFSFFKENRTQEGALLIEHQIDIYPNRKYINVWEFTYEPSLLSRNWDTIERDEIKVSADEALMIAEQNGGYEERMAVNDDCQVSITLSPNPVNYHGWHIRYSTGTFSISVDPVTGEISE